ncbi:ABC transporter E family member 2-like [Apium graveolens]|uniref:ABC transporter E family member 2-like n=1 Tax=Apium graveolens TaxID=4045 RepID=UPI003D7BA08F
MTSKGVQVRVRSSIRFKPPPRVERDENEFCRRWGKLCHGCCSCQADPMRPKHLDENTVVHRYNPGNYKLYGLPVPKLNQVLGLVGPSVIGKSVVFDIFSRKVTPNLGCPENPPTWEEIFEYFKDTNDNMYNYFTRIVQDQVKVCVTQDTEFFARRGLQGIVGELLDRKDETGMKAEICSELGLNQILERNLVHLSSGEFQRFSIGLIAVQKAGVYIFEQPSNFLDVKQRHKAAQVIRSLSRPDSYVMVADNDLSVLGYVSDYICCLYGLRGAYGVVSLPLSVREGINVFLNGFVQIRNSEESPASEVKKASKVHAEELIPLARYKYPSKSITRGNFKLKVNEGEFTANQIIVLLGENGTGKSTFIRMLASFSMPDTVGDSAIQMPKFCVSYKAQEIKPQFPFTVRDLLNQKIFDACQDPEFMLYVLEPLEIIDLMNRRVIDLVRGQVQRLALCLCLGKPADLYLIDEASAYLSAEQNVIASKVIKGFIRRTKKTAVVVDHDFMVATYLADRVIVFEGSPSIHCTANSPRGLLAGMNLFLSHLDISCRKDSTTSQPVFNKSNSACDMEQKSAGHYYLED